MGRVHKKLVVLWWQAILLLVVGFGAPAGLVVVTATTTTTTTTTQQQQEQQPDEEDADNHQTCRDASSITWMDCRNNPTWRNNGDDDEDDDDDSALPFYATCQALTGWPTPSTRHAAQGSSTRRGLPPLQHAALRACFDQAWQEAWDNKYSKCRDSRSGSSRSRSRRSSRDDDHHHHHHDDAAVFCQVPRLQLTEHYHGPNEGEGQIMTFDHVLSAAELDALHMLGTCAYNVLPREWPHYQNRTDIGTNVVYTNVGAHYCTYLQGLLQWIVPGVAAALHSLVHAVYEVGDLRNLRYQQEFFPPPDQLGIRTAEYLTYNTHHRVGLHADTLSYISVSLALTDPNHYQGGNFHLQSVQRLFTVPTGSAIVFFSESQHGVTPVTAGTRQVLVTEFWHNDDAPIGLPRPNPDEFANWKKHGTMD